MSMHMYWKPWLWERLRMKEWVQIYLWQGVARHVSLLHLWTLNRNGKRCKDKDYDRLVQNKCETKTALAITCLQMFPIKSIDYWRRKKKKKKVYCEEAMERKTSFKGKEFYRHVTWSHGVRLSLCAASRMLVRRRFVVMVPPEGGSDLESRWDTEYHCQKINILKFILVGRLGGTQNMFVEKKKSISRVGSG